MKRYILVGVGGSLAWFAIALFGQALINGLRDYAEMADPGNPSANRLRIYADSSTHRFTCKTSAGADCFPAAATESKTFAIDDPDTNVVIAFQIPYAATISNIQGSTIGASSTVSLNVEKRAQTTIATPGTDVLSAELVADTNNQSSCASGCDVNTIASATVTAYQWIVITISSTANTPTHAFVTVTWGKT